MTTEREDEESWGVNEIKKMGITVLTFKFGLQIAIERGKIKPKEEEI